MLSLIVPCFRHARDCKKTLRHILQVYRRDIEVIVVIDGLENDVKDQEMLKDMKNEFAHVKFLEFQKRLGKGGAIKKGILCAKGEWIGFIDADLVIDPRYLSPMLDMLKDSNLSGVVGKRTMYQTSCLRSSLSILFRLGNRILFCALPWDTQAGIKVFRADEAKRVFTKLRINGYAFDLDILLQLFLKGKQIAVYPVIQRMRGHSNVSFLSTFMMLRDTLSLYFWFIAQELFFSLSHPLRGLLFLRHIFLFPAAFLLKILLIFLIFDV